MSHAWSSGQDQTHTLVRQLQLLAPTIRLWLDVEQLQDVGRLEQSVRESATFVIFLSKGFFASKNCRRELYTALSAGKPIIIVHEIDEAKGGATLREMKEECIAHCTDALAPPPAVQVPLKRLSVSGSGCKSSWSSARSDATSPAPAAQGSAPNSPRDSRLSSSFNAAKGSPSAWRRVRASCSPASQDGMPEQQPDERSAGRGRDWGDSGADVGERVWARVLAGDPPINWVRMRDFQFVSLRMVVARMLWHVAAVDTARVLKKVADERERRRGSPSRGNVPRCDEHVEELHVPGTMQHKLHFRKAVRLLVCAQNSGAQAIAEELRDYLTWCDPSVDYQHVYEVGGGGLGSSRRSPSQRLAQAFSQKEASEPTATHMLLYLNSSTFSDGEHGKTAELTREAMDAGVTMVLVQEFDSAKGGVAFSHFYNALPEDLLKTRRLLDTIAVPLYPSDAHRAVSMLHIARATGGCLPQWWTRLMPGSSPAVRSHNDAAIGRMRGPPTSETKTTKLRQLLRASCSLRSSLGSSFRSSQSHPDKETQEYLRVQRRVIAKGGTGGAHAGRQRSPSVSSALNLSERRAQHAQTIAKSFAELEAADRIYAQGADTSAAAASFEQSSRHARRRQHVSSRVTGASPAWRPSSAPPPSPLTRNCSSQLSIYSEGQEDAPLRPSRGTSFRQAVRRWIKGGEQQFAPPMQHDGPPREGQMGLSDGRSRPSHLQVSTQL